MDVKALDAREPATLHHATPALSSAGMGSPQRSGRRSYFEVILIVPNHVSTNSGQRVITAVVRRSPNA
jgi:hypothetical protein